MRAFLAWLLRVLFPRPPAPIASLRPGSAAKVRGRVIARDLIDSPLRGEPCVYYRYLVEEWRASRAYVGGTWNPAQFDEAIAEFYIVDDTGRALVLPAGAEVVCRAAHSEEVGYQRRAVEACIGPDDVVEIDGWVDSVDDKLDDVRGYRDGAARVALRAPTGRPLRIRVV
jgi:hypothetical protein